MSATKRIIVYGGRGALGRACVDKFKSLNWWVGCIDMEDNPAADVNILVGRDAAVGGWTGQEQPILEQLATVLAGEQLDAVVCVAGGWAGGNASAKLAQSADRMWQQSVWSSTTAASIAANHLRAGGLLALTGAHPALKGTPGMIGYGMAKAAVHQLTRSMAGRGSGLPEGALSVAILPVTLDTPMNRKWMPEADFGTWTPLDFVAELFVSWANGENRPANGSLLQLITRDSVTEAIPSSGGLLADVGQD